MCIVTDVNIFCKDPLHPGFMSVYDWWQLHLGPKGQSLFKSLSEAGFNCLNIIQSSESIFLTRQCQHWTWPMKHQGEDGYPSFKLSHNVDHKQNLLLTGSHFFLLFVFHRIKLYKNRICLLATYFHPSLWFVLIRKKFNVNWILPSI